MKKKVLILLAVLLVALIAAIPAFADPPASSGPIVVRFELDGEDGVGFFYADERKGLSVTIGVDVVADCNGTFDADLVSIQEIHVPEDANRIISLLNGDDLTTTVWPFTEFDCGLFTTIEPVATGTSDLVLTDNDLDVGLTPDNVNWNAFGFTAHGLLTAQDGSDVHFNGVERCVWDGNNGATFSCVERINMH
jgi:hypothetical protein